MRQPLPVKKSARAAPPLPVRKNTLQAWDGVIRKNAARAKETLNLNRLSESFIVTLLRKWDGDYYNKQPSVTNDVYDNTRKWFAKLYPNNPYNESVGAPLPAKIQKCQLPICVGSLNKLRPAEVSGWMREIEKVLPQTRGWFLAPKFDGSSALLKYVPGKGGHVLAKAWRRGTGDVGGDVTATARYVQGVRHVLKPVKNIDPKGTYLVRVEVCIHRSIFNTYYGPNAPRAAEDREGLGRVYKDPRNLANGLLNRIDAKASAVDLGRCTAIAYYLFKWDTKHKTWLRPTDAHLEWLLLDQLGFTTAMNPTRYTEGHRSIAKAARDGDKSLAKLLPVHSPDGNIGDLCKFDGTPTVAEVVERLNTIKRSVDVPVDGLVIQPMQNAPWQKKGDHLEKRPFFVRSIKLDAHEQDHVDGTIKALPAEISKRGLLIPVIELKEPLLFGGVEVTNPNAINYANVVKWGLRQGRKVRIVRSGDVIPRVVAVFDKGKWMPMQRRDYDGEETKIVDMPGIKDPGVIKTLPTVCPACATKLVWTVNKDGKRINLACPNTKCTGRHGQEMIAFFKTLGVEDVAEGTINHLVASGMDPVQKILRGATAQQLMKLEGYQQKQAKVVSEAIAGALKNKPLAKVMHASGVFSSNTFSMGSTRLQAIVDHVGVGRVLRENPLAIRRKLATLKGLGDAGMSLFMEKLQEWRRFYETIRDLHTESSNRTLASVVACFTGFRSPEAERYITERGGRVASSVSKNVNVLFAGSLGSGKCAKADKLGVVVVAESKMWEWLHALKG